MNLETFLDRHMPATMRPYWNRMRASSIGYRLAHGAFWSTTGAGITQMLMMVMSIIIARILGREHFGEYGIVFATVGMFNVVAACGLGTTATKYVAEYRRTDPARAGRIIGLSNIVALITSIVATTALLGAADMLATHTLAAPQLAQYLRVGAGIIFFGALNSAQAGALAGFEAFRVIARINLITGLLSFPLVVAGAYYFHLTGALAGQVVALAIACMLNALALRKLALENGVPSGYTGCWQERSVLISFSLPAILAGILISPVNWACAAILVNQHNGYVEMGIYNAANSWQKAILFLPGSFAAITLPMLSGLHGDGNRQGYLHALKYNLLLNGLAACGAAIIISVFSAPIMSAYGPGFVVGKPVLIMLCFSAVLISMGSVAGAAIISTGRIWNGFLLNLVWATVFVLSALYLIPRHGAYGLAAAAAFAYALHLVTQFSYLAVSLKRRPIE